MECRKARYFWRGFQHLLWAGRTQQWVVPSGAGYSGQGEAEYDEPVSYETNIYQGYGKIVIATLSANTPQVRMFPSDPQNAMDVSASEAAEGMRQIIERHNDMRTLLINALYLLYTDGRILLHSRYVENEQKFGKDENGDPKGCEQIDVYGALETKLPILAEKLDECQYCQLSIDTDITFMRARYPDVADKIVPSSGQGSGESEYERLARISTKQGTRLMSQAGDTLVRSVVWQRTWLRPAAYTDIDDVDTRKLIADRFPNGVMVSRAGSVFCEAIPESMDDHFVLIHALPGDGMFRNGLGTALVSLQERYNDILDLIQDCLQHTIPVIWTAQAAADLQALGDTRNLYGRYLPIEPTGAGALNDSFFQEQGVEIPQYIIVMMKEFQTDLAQFLVGAFPAMFGGEAGMVGETAQGMLQQKNAALGVQGITWRALKDGYSNMMKQAVLCSMNRNEQTISETVPGGRGSRRPKSIQVNLMDLKGKFECYPDTNEAFPETWDQKSAKVLQLALSGDRNPALAGMFTNPDNIFALDEAIGVEGLYFPQLAGRNRQLEENDELIHGIPMPNPAIDQLKKQAAMMVQQMQQNPATQQQIMPKLQQMNQMAGSLPPEVSSIPITKNYDDHAAHLAEVTRLVNSTEGLMLKRSDPDAFLNLTLHGDEHRAAMQEAAQQQQQQQIAMMQAAKAKPPETKLPSVSIASKDLTPGELNQALGEVGIQGDSGQAPSQNEQVEALKIQSKAGPQIVAA